MIFTSDVNYGIMTAFYLATYGKTGAKQISEHLGLDLGYLHHILSRLTKNKVISSIKGPNGGYYLSKGATLEQIFSTLKPEYIVDLHTLAEFTVSSEFEKRSLAKLVAGFDSVTKVLLLSPIESVVQKLRTNEENQIINLKDTRIN